jgi:hypothetical protein
MPYTPSTVPDNVPKKYAAQFSEVWNSAYAAAIADKKSPAQAEETAFAQAHGVILKAKQKDERDVSSDGPGFGPTETKSEDGGQVSDPQQSLRGKKDKQPRDKKGRFGSDKYVNTFKKGDRLSDGKRSVTLLDYTTSRATVQHDDGETEQVESIELRYSEDQPQSIRGGPGSGPHAGTAEDKRISALKLGDRVNDGGRHGTITDRADKCPGKGFKVKYDDGSTENVGAEALEKLERSLRYSEDQPRDDHGRFGSGDGGKEDYNGEHVSLSMTMEQAQSVSQGGKDASEDVQTLMKDADIKAQLDKLDPEDIKAELKSTGAWDDEELKDEEANKERLVWIAGGDIKENGRERSYLGKAVERRFAEDQLRRPDGKFASNAGENAHTTEEHLKAQSEHVGKAREALKAGDRETAKAHGDAAAAHSKAAFALSEEKEAVGGVARVASKVANEKSGIK